MSVDTTSCSTKGVPALQNNIWLTAGAKNAPKTVPLVTVPPNARDAIFHTSLKMECAHSRAKRGTYMMSICGVAFLA